MSFQQAHENLGLKGVQLESMGYLHFRHAVEFGAFESVLRPIDTKYSKYWQLNALNLRQLKQQSFNENNYEQIENFVEYENFLNRSFYHHLHGTVVAMFDVMRQAATNPEFAMEYFSGHASLLTAPFPVAEMTRTQDIKVIQSKFKLPPVTN